MIRTGTVAAVLLLLGGGTAVAVGVAGQDPDPTAPPQATAVAAPPTPSTPTAATPSAAAPASSAAGQSRRIRPVEIRIPSIGVSSEVTVVGLNADGTLQVPQPGPDYDKAAWYQGSPAPGQTGPSVIEGHVDSARNGPSVFYDLGKVAVGDTVEVTREDGSVVTFVVDDVKAFPKGDFPTLAVYGNTSRPELRLITCGGEFDRARGHYVDNTVVFAHQVWGAPGAVEEEVGQAGRRETLPPRPSA